MHNLVFTDGIKKTKDISDIIYRVRQVVKALRYKTNESESVEQEMSDVSEMCPYFEDDSDEDESDEDENDDSSDESHDEPNATNITGKLKSLKLDVVTRWYSQLFMLESVEVRGRQQINIALQK